jgi:Holliday junction resolvase RusA-like endonuclease
MTLSFTVAGVSQPKGSTKAFRQRGTNRIIVTNDNPKCKAWARDIAQVAAIAMSHHGLLPLTAVPVALDVTFYLPRPQKYETKRNALIDFPHITKPDTDKLARAVKDALTGVVWHDDAQVTLLIARKHYAAAGEFPRAVFHIWAKGGISDGIYERSAADAESRFDRQRAQRGSPGAV